MITRRRLLVFGLTLCVMAGLLVWSFSRIKIAELRTALETARWGYLPLGVLAGLAVFPIKAWRWRVLLGNPSKPSLRTLFSAIMIGFMVNCIASRVGEIVRAAVLGMKREMTTSKALASIALERVFDLVTVLLFLVGALLWLHPQSAGEGAAKLASLRVSGVIAAAALAAGAAFLALLRLRPEAMTRIILSLFGSLPDRFRGPLERFTQSFLEGLNGIRSVRHFAALMGLSIAHWAVQVLFFLAMGRILADLHMALPGAMLVFAVTALGVGAAPTPAYLGVYQAAVNAAGDIMGVARTLSSAYGWLCWGANVPVVILVGLVCLWLEGLSLGDLRATASGAVGKRAGR